jgi:hypothetical protein
MHGVDRDSRHDAGKKEPRDTDRDGQCAGEGLSGYDIAIADLRPVMKVK